MSLGEILDKVHVDYLESSKDRIPLCLVRPNILRRIVAGDDHMLRSDLSKAAVLILCEEWLVLGPPLQVA